MRRTRRGDVTLLEKLGGLILSDKPDFRLWTSYFARVRQLPEGFHPVSIALYGSRWVKVPASMREFAPDKEMLKAEDWREQYEAKMNELISHGGVPELLAELPTNSVLVCHEKDPAECHRTILAGMLREHFGIQIEEWTP